MRSLASLSRIAIVAALCVSGPRSFAQGPLQPRQETRRPAQGRQAPASAPASAEADDPKLDQILRRWEEVSSQTETIIAEFDQIDELVTLDRKHQSKGTAFLKRPDRVVLQINVENPETGDFEFDRRIMSTGGEIIEFDKRREQVTVYPLPEDDRQRAMEEGPLPFLFRMNARAFKQRYLAKLLEETEAYYRIAIIPRHEIDREAFDAAVIYLDRQTLQPKEIHTRSPNGKDMQHYYIRGFWRNPPQGIDDQAFTWSREKERQLEQRGWRVVHSPGPAGPSDERQPAPNRPAPTGRAGEPIGRSAPPVTRRPR